MAKKKKVDLRGRRFSPEQRATALMLIAAGNPREEVAAKVETTTESLRRWVQRAERDGTMPVLPAKTKAPKTSAPALATAVPSEAKPPRSPYAPADPAQGLSDVEVAGILEWKRKHPSMGPAQLRAQLKRFRGWRISLKAIARVLRGHGYEPVHRGKRPKGPEPKRFEAPRRNALWQMDFCEVRVGEDKLYVLIAIDDFSRYCVGFAVSDAPSSNVVTETFRAAMARHGKPECVRTDRGGGFTAFSKEGDFGRVLEAELVDHIVGKSYSPRGGGKVESAVGTLKRELWELFHFEDRHDAELRLARFFDEYNEDRAHMGIDGLTPADRFFGRADRVLARIDAISRGRQAAIAMTAPPGGPIEELGVAPGKSPMEVLRLTLHDGVMELRFCGARVVLGRVTT
ncbi:MAG: transposase [Deltaproteobacteria bacterium]|nr:transposase [Deltaproteobacteria bacterium]